MPTNINSSNLLYNSYRFNPSNSARRDLPGANNGQVTDGRYGFDCSGFVNFLLNKGGYAIGAQLATRATVNTNGTLTSEGATWQSKIDTAQVKPGDLVYFEGHVGVVVSLDASGKGVFRSSTTSKGVVDSPFDVNLGWEGKPFRAFTRVNVAYDSDKNIWANADTSKYPPLELAPALSTADSGARWLNTMGTWESQSTGGYAAIRGTALGRYQLQTDTALRELGYTNQNGNWTGKEVNGVAMTSKDVFLKSTQAQDSIAREYADTLRSQLKANGAWDKYVDQIVGGQLVTAEGLIGAAWERGAGGALKVLNQVGSEEGDFLSSKSASVREFGKRLDQFRGALPPGQAGQSSAVSPDATLPVAIGHETNRPDYVENTNKVHHQDGSTTRDWISKVDSPDGSIKQGDSVSVTFNQDGTFSSRQVWHVDGTVESWERTGTNTATGEPLEVYSRWDSTKVVERVTYAAGDLYKTPVPGSQIIWDGKKYNSDGTPVLDPQNVETPLPIDPSALGLTSSQGDVVTESSASQIVTQDIQEQQIAAGLLDDNFGLSDWNPAEFLSGTQLGFLPSAQTDTVAKLEAELVAQGFDVTHDGNGIYASKGDQYLSITAEGMTFQKGDQWATLAIGKSGIVISGSHLGDNERELHVDVNGVGVVLLGHLEGIGDDLADNESAAFAMDHVMEIDGQALPADPAYALDSQDYEAFSLTYDNLIDGTVNTAGQFLLVGLDPATQATTGAPIPQVQVTPLSGGQTWRSLEVAGGTTFSSLRDFDGEIVSVTFSRELGAGVKVNEVYDPNNRLLYTEKIEPVLTGADAGRIKETLIRPDGSGYILQRGVDGLVVPNSNVDIASFDQRLATVFSDVPGLINAIKGGQPLPILSNGLKLLNNLDQLTTPGGSLPALGAANTIAAGALSLYNLNNALQNGNDYDKFNATLSTLNYVNIALNTTANGAFALGSTAAGLNTVLNGSPLNAAGGSIGVLPALGLINAIQNNDPVGMAMSIGTMIQGSAFLTTNPVGWVLIGVQILQALSAEGPPKAWGAANVSFGPGITNYGTQVNATGENFGTAKVQGQLQSTIDALNSIISQHNAATPDSAQRLGIIPQRLPSLNYKAAEFADKGYAVADIDALTGAQRYANLRFDDSGQVFGLDPNTVTDELRAMLGVQGAAGYPQLNSYMLNSALQRQAIAPMWEVQTAKMQTNAGDPNAGLTEEERAAKAGLGAAVDAAYIAAHPSDVNASKKRVGHFMPIGIDLDRNGAVSTLSMAQTEAANHQVTFDWDGTGYQKQTGWIGANDGFLVLDRNFNNSVDNGTELLSNPLVADPAKGLRTLAAFDANGDGRIDANDPVYQQLKVWQDLDQDGNNTHNLTVGNTVALAQDETAGVKELRSLAEAGITAIDYANSRYEFNSVLGNKGVGYGSIFTQNLEAQDEGVLYTPVQGGIRIDSTNGAPEVVVTQVQSEAAVYTALALEAAGETIALSEDGTAGAYNPNTQGGPITITISAAQLLGNDTWHGAAGSAAGLVISGVGGGSHLGSLAVTAQGNVSLTLEANYNGQAGFSYTVKSLDGQTRTAQVGLNITPVNDLPTATVATDASRAVYGYQTLKYYKNEWTDYGLTPVYAGWTNGEAMFAPFVQEIPGTVHYDYVTIYGEVTYTYRQWTYTDPTTYAQRYVPIATEVPNTGVVSATDLDGSTGFTFEVVGNPLYGKAAVDATTGRWSYTGLRPSDVYVSGPTAYDFAGWVDVDSGIGISPSAPRANAYSNRHIAGESSFLDTFTVRVHDSNGGFIDKQVQAVHYGPPPAAIVSGSGSKKPIAIDLDGNGFQFTDVNDSNVFMDVNGDGWKRRMAWVKPGDGLIAYDKDGNGKIESVDEFSFVGYAPGQQSDMAAVRAAFDSNGNGVLDAGDAKWAQFGVWQDANSNGVQEAGEYRSLSELGFSSVGLTSDGHFQVINGQTVHGLATATKTDGTQMSMADVTLRTSNEAQVPSSTGTNTTVVVSKFGQGQAFDGTADKDLVLGTAASDAFRTGDGDDVIMDDGGNDTVEAGAGDDLIYIGIDNDIVNAGAGNDTVFAGAGNDVVFGDGANETGDDVIMLEDGNDVAFGGNGNDFISGGTGNDVLSGNDGRDQLFGEGGWDALFGQEGDDELWGMEGNDLLEGGLGNDLLNGGVGDDRMAGGAGDDTYEVDSVGDTVTELMNGTDAGGLDTVRASISYTLDNTLENLTLTGSADLSGTGNASVNVLVGNGGRNTLLGLADNDVLDGGLGADTLVGGTGDDTYMVDNIGDVVTEAASEGTDTVQSRVSYALAANVENLTLVGINAINGTGNGMSNVLQGNAGTNVLTGGAGVDSLRGNLGNDTYAFALGDGVDTIEENDATVGKLDTISFGAGITSAAVTAHRAGQDFVLSYSATDSVTIKNWYDSGANKVEQVRFVDGTSWSSAQLDALANHAPIVTNAPATQLLTEARAFSYVLPDNIFTDEDMGDHLTLSATQVDRPELPSWLTFNAATRTLSGTPPDTAAGLISIAIKGTDEAGAFATTTLSLDIANIINGTVNADTLTGTTWRDVIDGKAGSDNMTGGAGDDIFLINVGSNGEDRFQGDAGYDVILGGVGDDTIRVNSFAGIATVEKIDGGLGVNVIAGTGFGDNIDLSGTELVNIARIDGGAGDDKITGSVGNDIIVGGAGNNTLVGGAGDDTFLLNGSSNGEDRFQGDAGYDVILGGVGDDTIRMNSFAGNATVEKIDGGLGHNKIIGTGYTDIINLSLTELVNIASVDGGEGSDTIIGSAGNDVIIGGTGGDYLSGGAGDDTFLINGTDGSSDQFQGDAGYDVVLGGVGDDTIRVHTHSGAATVEKIDGGLGVNVIAGSSSDWDMIDVSGTELINIAYIDAGAGMDTIIGSAGNDVIIGGTGGDKLYGGAGDDTFLINGTDGSSDQFQGDAGYDVVLGGVGDDTIRVHTHSGAATVEKIDGGLGVNVIAGSSSDWDMIDVSGTELINIAYIDAGAGMDTIIGSAGNDVIIGGTGGDKLFGGAGDDTFLLSGTDAGFDRFQGDAGYDVILGGAGDDAIRMDYYGGTSTVEKIDGGAGVNIIKGDVWGGGTMDFSGTQLVNIARIEGGGSSDGGAYVDTITGSIGNDVIDGGLGADKLYGSGGADWIMGGKGNDTLDGGLGSNIFAFNRGDGADTINNSTWGNDIVSLGGGISYASLKLIKTGSDLVLDAGAGDRLSLKNWYANAQNHGIGRLQVVTVGGDYDAASSDITRNKQVELFNFAKLVQNFDAAVAANSSLATTGWNVMNNLLDAHLSASDTQALGGDLSFQYATTGNLVGIGLVATPTELQTLKPHV